MAAALTLTVGNPNPIHLEDVQDELGNAVSTLAPLASLFDALGAPVALLQNVPVPAVAGSPGEYRGTLGATGTATLSPDRNYTLRVTAPGLLLVLPCRAKEWGSF